MICGGAFILGNRLTRALQGKVDVVNENDDDDDNAGSVKLEFTCFP